jgi:hypothetical protein
MKLPAALVGIAQRRLPRKVGFRKLKNRIEMFDANDCKA